MKWTRQNQTGITLMDNSDRSISATITGVNLWRSFYGSSEIMYGKKYRWDVILTSYFTLSQLTEPQYQSTSLETGLFGISPSRINLNDRFNTNLSNVIGYVPGVIRNNMREPTRLIIDNKNTTYGLTLRQGDRLRFTVDFTDEDGGTVHISLLRNGIFQDFGQIDKLLDVDTVYCEKKRLPTTLFRVCRPKIEKAKRNCLKFVINAGKL